MTTTCKHCGTEELDHHDGCPAGAFGRVRLTAGVVRHQESEILRLRDQVRALETRILEMKDRAERAEAALKRIYARMEADAEANGTDWVES